ncbi:AMP-binding protein [Arenibacterium halophilum]|uniref:Long-chain fatty acid--CoA ligase n=1 Tax=Arenibacterium halophilum TaxID=2583821 RepID=A0ABY2X6Z8_9RHOB|nr:AMP-binding protein [Arenibacterium halophilum]TMV11559.1 long-chain fatty acid--CoA ligase [Arenibacterium halophilum]
MMTDRVFRALALHALQTPFKIALRSGARTISYCALAGFLAESAKALASSPRVVGISCDDPLEAALADIALTFYGHVAVHVPPFFSPTQRAHIATAAEIETFIGRSDTLVATESLPRPEACPPLGDPLNLPVAGARRIIFTSGSSGTPKGVIIGERQMAAAIAGLEKAISPRSDDRHLSLLPVAQLLEQVAGLYLPLLAGAEVCFCPEALTALFGGPMEPVMAMMEAARPTTTILVPALLARMVSELKLKRCNAPESLRLVAVGGAKTSPALLADAKAHGLHVYEGYGLSECCSVVSMARPGNPQPGTVGEILDGVRVRIDDGEIVVSGPTVMEGYIGQTPVSGEWRTGDLGRIENGHLIIEGRKDWLIVTPQGRNINPEWVESCLCADPNIPAAGLRLAEDGMLEIIAVITAPVDPARIKHLLANLPQYARPVRVGFAPASHEGLVKPGGGIDRSQLGHLSASLPFHSLCNERKERVA